MLQPQLNFVESSVSFNIGVESLALRATLTLIYYIQFFYIIYKLLQYEL